MKAIKNFGMQTCDCCNREFEAIKDREGTLSDWECPYCHFDNKVGVELGLAGLEAASEKAAGRWPNHQAA